VAINKSQILHARNRHTQGYDFKVLCDIYPALTEYVVENHYLKTTDKAEYVSSDALTIDFSNALAVKYLNAALLKQYYQINLWDIPKGYLCPPIPGRVDYIHYLADLLKTTNANELPRSKNITVLDVGMGASCIYPILGKQVYQWRFVASDVDPISINNAEAIINNNDALINDIDCRLQRNNDHIFDGIIQTGELYDLTMCNPPFHQSLAEANKGSQRKWQNLSKKQSSGKDQEQNDTQLTDAKALLNFGGQKAELWCPGGEIAFIRKMIKESRHFQQQVLWFTSLVSKKDNISAIKFSLKKANAKQIKVVNMAQGQKISRFIAWSFMSDEQQALWCKDRL
jgi:23S rRNA (adenine1618-N6)-methyltransferase